MLQAGVKCAKFNLIPFVIGLAYIIISKIVIINGTTTEPSGNCPSPIWFGEYMMITYIFYSLHVVIAQLFMGCCSNSDRTMGFLSHLIANISYVLMMLNFPIMFLAYRGCRDQDLSNIPNWGDNRAYWVTNLLFGNLLFAVCYTIIIFCCNCSHKCNEWWDPISVSFERV